MLIEYLQSSQNLFTKNIIPNPNKICTIQCTKACTASYFFDDILEVVTQKVIEKQLRYMVTAYNIKFGCKILMCLNMLTEYL